MKSDRFNSKLYCLDKISGCALFEWQLLLRKMSHYRTKSTNRNDLAI
ncbi:MAG: hypothetical protein ACTS6A_00325 [Candidatus Hodgkinia cicadicola]